MRTSTTGRARGPAAPFLLAALALSIGAPRAAHGLVLDDRGEMRLGMRAYTAVRVGTEKMGSDDDPLTWPGSAAGHVRQHRYFLELKLDHDIRRLATTGWGAARLFGWLDPDTLKYSLQYRGEGEGIYDYGPSEYSDQGAKLRRVRLNTPELEIPGLANLKRTLPEEYIRDRIDRLNNRARQRHRLFLAYIDFDKGPFFMRIGRQILAWGETDIFRALQLLNVKLVNVVREDR